MKKLSIVILFIMGLVSQSLFAQITPTSKGRVIDAKGSIWVGATKIGSVSRDSIVRNANGRKIAFVKEGGILVNAKGETLGKMGKDGNTYYNADGALLYTLKENTDTETCNVLDAKGKVIGNVHNNFKGMACTLHCFSNQMDMVKHQKTKN